MKISLRELNEKVRNEPKEYVKQCEARYDGRIKRTAAQIMENMKISPIVLLSGPSGAGKTTSAKRLEDELERHGINSHTVSLDNYFNTLDPENCPKTPEGDVDFESPDLLDLDLLNEHFEILSDGGEIDIPYFEFTEQRRSDTKFTHMKLKDNEIAIFEGIHALNDIITERNPKAFGLYICTNDELFDDEGNVFKPEWVRMVRRIIRDNNSRGADAAYTLALWENVLRGEKVNINPFIGKADTKLNSSIGYEMAVLKDIVLPQLRELSEDMRGYEYALEIMPMLEKIESLPASYVPQNSLLREFIGEGVYEY